MSTNSDQIINDHEIRLRVLERIAEGIEKRFDKIEARMDSHFHWTLGIMITLFGGIILHMAKLI